MQNAVGVYHDFSPTEITGKMKYESSKKSVFIAAIFSTPIS
jgi:hypothetical protein